MTLGFFITWQLFPTSLFFFFWHVDSLLSFSVIFFFILLMPLFFPSSILTNTNQTCYCCRSTPPPPKEKQPKPLFLYSINKIFSLSLSHVVAQSTFFSCWHHHRKSKTSRLLLIKLLHEWHVYFKLELYDLNACISTRQRWKDFVVSLSTNMHFLNFLVNGISWRCMT